MIVFLLSLIAAFLGCILYVISLGMWKYIGISVIIAVVYTVIYYNNKAKQEFDNIPPIDTQDNNKNDF